MKHSHRFFSNKDCMFYPCHEVPDGEFNCLFCYCPLYPLGEKCGGIFTWAIHEDIKIKLCNDCHLPHTPEYFDTVMNLLNEENISKMFRDNK